jgi:competence protein ComEC
MFLSDILPYMSLDFDVFDSTPKILTVHFIDVGHGDSTFVQLPNGQTMLIDAGGADMGDAVVKYLKSLGVSEINYLIASILVAEHIGGMPKVVRTFNIGGFDENGVRRPTSVYDISAYSIGGAYSPDAIYNPDSEIYLDLNEAIYEKGTEMNAIQPGRIIWSYTAEAGRSVIDKGKIKAEFLSPFERFNHFEQDPEEIRDYSAVLKLTYGKVSFLFMGDAGFGAELALLKTPKKLKADVLKVANHGSFTSSNEEFLSAVSPGYAVISCGGNDFEYPHESTVERLTGYADVYRTDLDGTVIISTDGKEITVETLAGE